MTRLRADLLLLVAAALWGSTFIAQITGMQGLGPFGFVAARFTISFFLILPFALCEKGNGKPIQEKHKAMTRILCVSFCAGVILQQIGMLSASATDGGFLTSIYVILVPFIAWALFRKQPPFVIWPGCLMALLGVWLLNGATLNFSAGDWYLGACALMYGVQVALIGYLAKYTARPLALSVLQYGVCAAFALVVAVLHEHITLAAVMANLYPILYAGIISGGIAYTLQAVAQEHTPPSDAAIIMAAEAPFAALAGYFMLGERLTPVGWAGCALILAAIVLVEARGIRAFFIRPKPQI